MSKLTKAGWIAFGLVFLGVGVIGAMRPGGASGPVTAVLSALSAALGLGFLVFTHELGHYLGGRIGNMAMPSFQIGFGPALWSWTSGETEWKLCPIPLGGAVRFVSGEEDPAEMEEWRSDPRRRSLLDESRWMERAPFLPQAWTLLAGPVFSILVAAPLFWSAMYFWGAETDSGPATIKTCMKGMPAEKAGLLPGDNVLAVNGKQVTDVNRAVHEISAADGTINLTINRNDAQLNVPVTLMKIDGRGRIGAAFETRLRPCSAGEAIQLSFSNVTDMSGRQARGIFLILTGQLSLKHINGPVGMLDMSSHAAAQGFRTFIMTIAMFTIALGVFNLFPIPLLDGGRLLFLGLKALWPKRITKTTELCAAYVGIAAILMLTAIGLFNDVVRMF